MPCAVEACHSSFCFQGGNGYRRAWGKTVDMLVDSGLIKGVSDLYFIKKEDLLKLPRFAEKSVDNLLNAIEESKSRPLSRFIYALGIPNVGEHVARLLAKSSAALKI